MELIPNSAFCFGLPFLCPKKKNGATAFAAYGGAIVLGREFGGHRQRKDPINQLTAGEGARELHNK